MIGTFFWAMAAGHIYIVGLVSAVQVITFKEVIAIANVPSREKKLQFTKSLNWYFLAATMYFLYGESVIYYFKHIVLVDAFLLPLATHHRFISFVLYMMGMITAGLHHPSRCVLLIFIQALYSLLLRSRKGTTSSNSRNLHGHTWFSTLLSSSRTSS
jgi:CDP-diglyceride synthetase